MTTVSPSQAEINSVIALYSNGQIQEALDAVETLTKDYPKEPLLYNISGVCYKAIGQLEAAVKSFEKALAIKPDYAEVNYNLGLTLQELGQLDFAVKCYENALAVNPEHAEAHNNLGVTLKELGQLDTAIEHYERAIAIKPDYAEVYYNLGNAFRVNGQQDAAVESFEKAITIKPDYPGAHNNLGIIFMELGQKDSAFKSYEKSIDIKPDYAEAHLHLSTIKKYTANDPQIAQMHALLSASDLSKSDRMSLCFALAKVYEDLGNRDNQFKFLREGNRLRKQGLNYSLDNDQVTHSIVKKLFAPSSPDIEKSLSYEASTIRPIFILGMPRSGTSLVEQIIASHHEVYGAGELNTLNNLVIPIVKNRSTQDTNGLSEETCLSIRQGYFDSLSRLDVPEKVISDKMPLNFQYIGFILSAFPEAKIIHMKRDARATCWSIYKHHFDTKGNGWAYNVDDLAGFYGLYIDFMAFWHQVFPGKIYDICYEDLTVKQEEETRKLLEYCELDWDENCLSFYDNKRVVKTASASQVRQKMYQGSSEAWKKHEAYLQPLIKALGYY